jgi:hypothetical protein
LFTGVQCGFSKLRGVFCRISDISGELLDLSAAGIAYRALFLAQQLRQLRKVRRNPAGLILPSSFWLLD